MGLFGGGSRISRFDMYRSLPKDLSEPTSIGGSVSLFAMALMSYLFLSELWAYLTPTVTSTLHVSNAADTFDMVTIHFNLTMHRLPCVVTSLDHQDVMGAHTMDMHGSVHKVRMAADGSVIGPYVQHEERAEIAAAAAAAAVAAPGAAAVDAKADAHGHGHDNGHSTHGHGHGAATPKMSALFAQDAAAQVGEGCRLEGSIQVKKVPGNFHVSAHAHADLLPRLFPSGFMDVSHSVHSLWFGEEEAGRTVRDHVASAQVDPLRGAANQLPAPARGQPAHSLEYFLEVVPTKFVEAGGRTHHLHQFVAHKTSVQGRYPIPAVYFRFNFSPIAVVFEAAGKPFSHFFVQVCAIVGGVFTVLGLVTSWLNTSYRVIVSKKFT